MNADQLLGIANAGISMALPRGKTTPWLVVLEALIKATAARLETKQRAADLYAEIRKGREVFGFSKAQQEAARAEKAYWLIDRLARRYKAFTEAKS